MERPLYIDNLYNMDVCHNSGNIMCDIFKPYMCSLNASCHVLHITSHLSHIIYN